MARRFFPLDRRDVLAGFGAIAAAGLLPRQSLAQGTRSLVLRARPSTLALRPKQADIPVWVLEGPVPRYKRGDRLEVTFRNDLPAPAVLDWWGTDGVPSLQAVPVLGAVAAGKTATTMFALSQAGTSLCGFRASGDDVAVPLRPLPVVVEEIQPPSADRDEVFLIEDFRLRPDGTAVPAGTEPKDATAVYTVNGLIKPEIAVRSNDRLRLRLISACQRQVIAVKIDQVEVRVMAMDSQPAEPFPVRNGALVLAPGGRTDALIDAIGSPGSSTDILLHDGSEARAIARLAISSEPPTRPAPLPPAPPLQSNGLPAQLDLKSALRVELALQGNEWMRLPNVAQAPAVFKTRLGRVVVLALSNRSATATVFHLHGHHFRLLDRFDDGWKPFWLDTLAIEPGQTQRIAFAAEHGGRWLMEATAADWAAPRFVRWYEVQ